MRGAALRALATRLMAVDSAAVQAVRAWWVLGRGWAVQGVHSEGRALRVE